MKYRLLGRTGLFVSEICFGTMTFGGRGFWTAIGTLDQAAVTALIKKALDSGINFYDTANVYSEGEAERLFGQALKDLGVPRSEVVIATKARGRMGPGPNAVGLSRGHLMDAVDDSLRRLGVDHIDLYQIHGWDPVVPLDETLRALDDLVHSGKVRYIGCSTLSAWQVVEAQWTATHFGLQRFVSCQERYNLLEREIDEELMPVIQSYGLGLIPFAPLASGLLTGKYRREVPLPAGARLATTPRQAERYLTEANWAVVERLEAFCAARGRSLLRLAIGWLLQRPAVASVIAGATTPEQVAANVRAAEWVLSREDMDEIDRITAK